MPDHLIAYILEITVGDMIGADRGRLLQEFGLVCKRFRNIVVDTPQLWRSITLPYHNTRLFDLHLRRSKMAGLSIDIHLFRKGNGLSPASVRILDKLLTHSARWEVLSIDIPKVRVGIENTLFKRLSGQCFPQLKSLDVKYPENGTNVPLSYHPYTTCELPNLRVLYLSYTSPIPSNCPTLTSFTATVKEHFDPVGLLRFLGALYALEKINLCFKDVEYMSDACDLQDLVLLNIKALEITLDNSDPDSLMTFREVLITPNVQKIVFRIDKPCASYFDEVAGNTESDSDDPGDLTQYLNFMFCHEKYAELVEFELLAANVPFDTFRDAYEIPFEKMPCLRILTLCTVDIAAEVVLADDILPPLSHIKLIGCYGYPPWEQWLNSLHHALSVQNKLSGLKELSIEGEDGIDINVNELFKGTRVVWDTYEPNPHKVRMRRC